MGAIRPPTLHLWAGSPRSCPDDRGWPCACAQGPAPVCRALKSQPGCRDVNVSTRAATTVQAHSNCIHLEALLHKVQKDHAQDLEPLHSTPGDVQRKSPLNPQRPDQLKPSQLSMKTACKTYSWRHEQKRAEHQLPSTLKCITDTWSSQSADNELLHARKQVVGCAVWHEQHHAGEREMFRGESSESWTRQ